MILNKHLLETNYKEFIAKNISQGSNLDLHTIGEGRPIRPLRRGRIR